MNKRLVMLVALLAVVAIAVPAMAVEFKYGGMYRLRWQSNDNLVYGDNNRLFPNDNQNYMDQRLRMYFTFVGSENLQVVTKFEVDTMWGNGFDKFSTGGGVGADSINLETKNVYVDFNVPYTPVRATLGVQGVSLLTGWMLDDDFSAAVFSSKFDPIRVSAGYIAGQNNDVTTTQENIDDFFVSVNYADGPYKAALIGLFQDGHNTDASTFFNPRMSTGGGPQGSAGSLPFPLVPTNRIVTGLVEDNILFNLGFNFEYKIDWVRAYVNFVKNLGSYDVLGVQSVDYTGYMVDAGANFYYGPFTFNLAGFLASGDNLDADESSDGNFRYARGASHYWSEIMGLGSLDQAIGGAYLNAAGGVNQRTTRTGDQLSDRVKSLPGFQGYQAADVPSNLWMINFGVAYQALEKTKLTFNYYYIGTQVDVLANFRTGHTDNTIGHEIDFYIDQGIVDGLNLRIVAAYLIADDGYTVLPSSWESDAWKAGMVLQWHF